MIDEAKIFTRHEFGPKGPKTGLKLVFCYLLQFDSLGLLETAYIDSLQQYLTSSRDKTRKNFLRAQIWAKWVKIDPQN